MLRKGSAKPRRRARTLSTSVNIWYKPESKSIAIAFTEYGLISTVSSNPDSVRHHAHLYRHLETMLRKGGLLTDAMPQ